MDAGTSRLMFDVDHATAAETAASIGDGPFSERVLVVEDDRATRYGLTELVRSWVISQMARPTARKPCRR